MLPGLIALNSMLPALQAVGLPLVFELSWTREIDDRLLSPMPVWAVALEKVAFASLRGILASLLMVPIGLLMVDVNWPASGLLQAFAMVVLGALVGASVGLWLGTAFPPRRLNIMFAVIFAPLLFAGSRAVPVAHAVRPALVPGPVRAEPADLHERGDPGVPRPAGPAHPAVDMPARPGGGDRVLLLGSASEGSCTGRSTHVVKRGRSVRGPRG